MKARPGRISGGIRSTAPPWTSADGDRSRSSALLFSLRAGPGRWRVGVCGRWRGCTASEPPLRKKKKKSENVAAAGEEEEEGNPAAPPGGWTDGWMERGRAKRGPGERSYSRETWRSHAPRLLMIAGKALTQITQSGRGREREGERENHNGWVGDRRRRSRRRKKRGRHRRGRRSRTRGRALL